MTARERLISTFTVSPLNIYGDAIALLECPINGCMWEHHIWGSDLATLATLAAVAEAHLTEAHPT